LSVAGHCGDRPVSMDAYGSNLLCPYGSGWIQLPHGIIHLPRSGTAHVCCGLPWLLWSIPGVAMHAGVGTYSIPGFNVHACVCRYSIMGVIICTSVGSYSMPGDITGATVSSWSIVGVVMHACTSMWSGVTKMVFSEEMWCVILDYNCFCIHSSNVLFRFSWTQPCHYSLTQSVLLWN
jgi:hypothetical protein